MDRNHYPTSISRSQLYAKIGTPLAPIVVDVRPDADVKSSDRLIVSASRQSPDTLELWARELPRGRLTVLYCVNGREASQTAAASLRALGLNAVYLGRGFEDWVRIGLPTRRNVAAVSGKWVTRERPKIDRIACPWLIRRFIDPSAQFLYVPTALVIATASQLNATPYDVEGVEFAHEGERCSFDTIIRIYDIRDQPLQQLASIVRGADTSRHDLAAQCGGLFAISLGNAGARHGDVRRALHLVPFVAKRNPQLACKGDGGVTMRGYTVAILWRGDHEARRAATPYNNRYRRVFEELFCAGYRRAPRGLCRRYRQRGA